MNPFTGLGQSTMNYVPIDMITEMVYRDYKFIGTVNVSDLLEWCGSIYDTLSVPDMFLHRVTGDSPDNPHITISNYRGELPLGFRRVLKGGVRDADTKIVYRTTTNTFTKTYYNSGESPDYPNTDRVFTIRGSYIFVEDETATIEMVYEAYPIDERGFPLIPDVKAVMEYVKNYIAEKVAFNLLAEGKISAQIYDIIDKRRLFGAGAAHTAVIRPDAEKMETWTWSRLKLIPKIGQHELSYAYHGNMEDLRLGTE